MMHILLTTGFLGNNTGSDLVIRDLAQALRRKGHQITVYSPQAANLRQIDGTDILVFNDLDRLDIEPDVIHGQHATSIIPAWRRFPSTPLIQSVQDVSHPIDEPLPIPSIRHYIAVDELRARRVRGAGVPDERITLIPNSVALERFAPKPAHDRISRGLVVAKYDSGFGDLARRALATRGIQLDVFGVGSGGFRSDFPERLAEYDLLIGSGRCVLEAAAVGLSAIVCDERGFAGPLTLNAWPRLRDGNFGKPVFTGPTTEASLVKAFDALDPSEASLLRDIVRREASLDRTADRLEDLYRRAVEDHGRADELAVSDPHLLDYIVRVQSNCLRNMTWQDVAEGQRSMAMMLHREETVALKQELAKRTTELAAELAKRTTELAAMEERQREKTREVRTLWRQVKKQNDDLTQLKRHLQEVQSSTSWRITSPLRRIRAGLRRLK